MYKFYGQSNQDQFIFERYFQNKKNGISIECGAFDGITESATFFFEENLDWVCINIESSPPIFNLLTKNRPKSFNYDFGLSNEEKILTFKHAIHPVYGEKFGNGSFNHKMEHLHNLNYEGCVFEEYQVNTTTYVNLIDKLMDENFLGKSIDLFVLDVEGFELEVLEGLTNSKYLPKILAVEYSHVGLDNIKSMLDKLHYKFDIQKNNDAYFVKL